jgi:hypothetical protein
MNNALLTSLSGRSRRRVASAALSALLTLAAGACSSSKPKTSEKAAPGSETRTVSAATLTAGEPVPAPTSDPVLRLTGRIGTTNTEGALALDVTSVERLGLVSFELYEPYQKRRMGFQGVPLGKVVDLAGAEAGAQEIHMVALDDYTADMKLTEARTEGVMLATRSADGSALPLEDGGPTRILFLDGTPGAKNDSQWVWSLATVEVR